MIPGNESNQVGTLTIDQARGYNIASINGAGKLQYVLWLCERFGKQFNTFPRWIEALGRSLPLHLGQTNFAGVSGVNSPAHWFGWEENRYERLVTIASITGGGGAGALTTVQLGNSGTTYGVDANGNFFGRVGEYFAIPITYHQARIHAIYQTTPGIAGNVVTFDLIPNNVSYNLSTEITAAINAGYVNFSITTNAWGYGTAQPTPVTVNWTQREFWTQILKETVAGEGQELVREYYPAFKDGKTIGVLTYDTAIAEWRLAKQFAGACLLGEVTNNPLAVQTNVLGNTYQIPTTQGMLPTIAALGNNYPSAAGTFDVEDLFNIKDFMIKEGITSNSAVMALGSKKQHDVTTNMKAYLQNNATQYTKPAQSAMRLINNAGYVDQTKMDFAVHVGFQEMTIDNFLWIFNTITEFSDPMGMGAAGYDLDQDGLVFPLEMIRGNNGQGGLENIAIRNVEFEGYDRSWEAWSVSGAGKEKPYVIADDIYQSFMRCHKGFQMLAANQFTRLYH